MRRRSIWTAILLGSIVLTLSLLSTPSICVAAPHNAVLYHTGPSGLEAYSAWTRKTATIVPGMPGTWDYPYWSPNRASVVTLVFSRPDFPVAVRMYCAVPGSGTYAEVFGDLEGNMYTFEGWLDDYTAVVTANDYEDNTYRYKVDTRTGRRQPLALSTAVTFPVAKSYSRTAGDRKYTVSVGRNQTITVRLRGKKKVVARFHLKGAGNSKSLRAWRYAGCSISPDGKFLAYQLILASPKDNSQPKSRVYVCTLKGKGARRIYNDWGGYLWRQ